MFTALKIQLGSSVSVGGAAGLFVGASVMSFVEILYYMTLKLFWYKKNIANERRQ